MIASFRHRGLRELFEMGSSRKIRPDLAKRIGVRLAAIHAAADLPTLANRRELDLHSLRGLPKRYTIHVNGPWCITFEWQNGDAFRVDLEQYH